MKNKKLKLYSMKISSNSSESPCRRYLTDQAMDGLRIGDLERPSG